MRKISLGPQAFSIFPKINGGNKKEEIGWYSFLLPPFICKESMETEARKDV